MEERNIKISIEKARDWYNRGGEYKELALSAFSEKEIKASMLPNTWEEFCKNYPIKAEERYIGLNSEVVCNERDRTIYSDRNMLPSVKAAKAHLAQMQLEQLRDCYRQGWVPDWKNSYQWKWCIIFDTDTFIITAGICYNHFLSFQSKEIAEKFLNNFKDLIETAGDLI